MDSVFRDNTPFVAFLSGRRINRRSHKNPTMVAAPRKKRERLSTHNLKNHLKEVPEKLQ